MRKEDRYDSLLQYYAGQFNLNWKLLKAQVRAESAMNPDAVSHVGAAGLAQFMPSTWNQDIAPKIRRYYETTLGMKYHKQIHRYDPEDSICGQAIYMRDLTRMMPSVRHAIAAYNWGMGNINKLIKKSGPNFEDIRGSLPRETRDYVARIERYMGGTL